MTLGLTIVSRHGTWQTSDMRLFNSRTKRPERDGSTKQFGVVTADGAAMITYAGIGRLADGNHVSDLMANLLRGEPRTMPQTVRAISAFATDRIAPVAATMPSGLHQHTFVVAGHRDGEPYFAEIRNVDVEHVTESVIRLVPRKDFAIAVIPVPHDGFSSIVGARSLVSQADVGLLNRIRGRRPARTRDFLQVLADTTNHASQRAPSLISAECWGWYMAPNAIQPEPPVAFSYGNPMPADSEPRMITHGFDFGAAMKVMVGELSKVGDPAQRMELSLDLFKRAMAQAMRIEVGQRVINVESGERGRVAVDPVPNGDDNDIGIYWDSDPRHMQVVHRGKIVVILPGT